MATYINPIDQRNPFFAQRPVTVTVRFVRVTGSGEFVEQPTKQLYRVTKRANFNRAYPITQVPAPISRKFPERGEMKKLFDPDTGA